MTSNELITRKNIELALLNKGQHSRRYKLDDIWELNYYEIREVLDDVDADAQPVVHGEWIVSHIPDSMLWECNQCGFDCGAHSFNFCPNCGAKMNWEGIDNVD